MTKHNIWCVTNGKALHSVENYLYQYEFKLLFTTIITPYVSDIICNIANIQIFVFLGRKTPGGAKWIQKIGLETDVDVSGENEKGACAIDMSGSYPVVGYTGDQYRSDNSRTEKSKPFHHR